MANEQPEQNVPVDKVMEQIRQDANIDQALQGLVNFARVVATYRDELIERGFTRNEALYLVQAYQTALLSSGRRD